MGPVYCGPGRRRDNAVQIDIFFQSEAVEAMFGRRFTAFEWSEESPDRQFPKVKR